MDIAKQSPLFADLAVHRIGNGIDRSVFRPIPKAAAREVLGLPPERPIVLYAAQLLDDNPRKGSRDAIAACNALKSRADFDLVLLGAGGQTWRDKVPQTIHLLGYVRDDRLLATAYAAADVAIAPSTVENLPNSILESMACGTPVVAYDSGGIGDAVRHGETGWLVETGNPVALADGIAYLLTDRAMRDGLARNAVRLIETDFDADREANAFAELYGALIAERRAGRP